MGGFFLVQCIQSNVFSQIWLYPGVKSLEPYIVNAQKHRLNRLRESILFTTLNMSTMRDIEG